MNEKQLEKMKSAPGFVAALDQSGGSTPGALEHYGVSKDAWSTEEEMFDLVHQMRSRVITSPAFTGERILGAILFEGTMDREIDGKPTADFLWEDKNVVPILKVDKGLAAEENGVQMMKPMPQLAPLLERAAGPKHIFGTKMRSVIKQASESGIAAIVDQQFEVAEIIIAAGLVPIIEPEVDIHCPEKAKAESLLKAGIAKKLDALGDKLVMLKLTLPEEDDLYADFVKHPSVVRVVALSGGYTQEEADVRLRKNHGVVASFSRALLEGLSAKQTDEEFNKMLDTSIQKIYDASMT